MFPLYGLFLRDGSGLQEMIQATADIVLYMYSATRSTATLWKVYNCLYHAHVFERNGENI